MASACVNNNFPNLPWLSSSSASASASSSDPLSPPKDTFGGDFEFHLLHDRHVTILPADELFLDGKLIPLHFPKKSAIMSSSENISQLNDDNGDKNKNDSHCQRLRLSDENTLFSPKAPRCSSRWREILGLKPKTLSSPKPVKTAPSNSTAIKPISHLLHRNHRSSTTSALCSSSDHVSLTVPLLQRSGDTSSSRRSLSLSSSSSSCSSGREHEDLPRLSLDEQQQRKPRGESNRHSSRPRGTTTTTTTTMRPPPQTRGVSMDSPRMNPAGKIVFQSLERSSSSPSTFNAGGGPRYKYKAMERSYSANVRVTRVLNVPGGFGLGHLFSSSSSSSATATTQKKDNGRSEKRRVHSHG